ncbi:MAG: nucleoside-diphosphate sugar epimerase/dehydratase, partial [Gaiellaceae bacterium]
MIRLPVNRHRVWQLVFDAVLIAAAWRLTFFLRFDKSVPVYYRHLLDWRVVALVVGIQLAAFVVFGFYNRWWRYVSTRDMWGAARGVTAGSLIAYLVLYAFPPAHTSRLPRSVAVFDYLLLLAFIAGTRLLARSLIERPLGGLVARGKEVLIIGAGDAGQLMVREMQRNRQLHYTPIGFVDDDPRKRGDRIHGVKILGTTDDLAHLLRDNKPDEVLIAIPSAPGGVRRTIVDTCTAANVPVKTLPGLHELIAGDLNLAGQIRSVQVEDVLGRQQVEVDLESISTYVKDKTVLVTGAGGSIGSELCRQLARLGAARIVLVDKGESALFEIERELVDERDFTAAIPVLANSGDRAKMRQVFERYRPQVLFHAAAYKHVGMLEANPLQAVANNVLATRAIAEVAVEFGVERFVLISTDKAANPKNVMGQSKAVCEWIIESFALHPEVDTRFVAVRFGNVLGSSGSVIPIFRKQIERGGPVTVTNPEMTRFFMTIPEASSLVIQAGAMGGKGQVYVLDMGQPVKILDLARQMIELSGRTQEQIKIEFVGSRAGEKMHEELWNDGED